MKMTKITIKMLKAGKACKKQTALFRKMFPDGAKFTRDNWEKAKRAGLDVLFCMKFLSPENLAKYNKIDGSAWAECTKICDSAWEVAKICELARIKRNKISRATWAEYVSIPYSSESRFRKYDKICRATWAEQIKVRDSAQTEYEKVRDSALFALLENQK
jgi:hypothetical protein